RSGDRGRNGYNEKRKNTFEERKNNGNDDGCYKCGKKGHYAKECKVGSSSRPQNSNERFEKNKKKESFVASWSDEESIDHDIEETNL
ncbi:zinc finger domain-containing protein, partial [Vibrio vulnificus]|uniref:C2HC-type zinc finger protein n=1 Tax=Vibrio vulnificus TaxID=672 RepID=UPI0019D43537